MGLVTRLFGWLNGNSSAGGGPARRRISRDHSGRKARRRHLAFELLERRELLSTLVWDGNGGNGKNYVWSAWSNWAPNRQPHSGDALVFSGTHKRSNWNNMSGLSIPQITIRSNGFHIDGNAITLGSGGIHLVGGSTGTIGLPLSLPDAATPIEVTGGRTLNLTDAISGDGGIAKSGTGTAILGAVSVYAGTTAVNAGTLSVAGALVNSSVVVNGGVLAGAGSVQSIDLNGGTVSPGSGVGTLTVTGGAMLDRGTLAIQLNDGVSVDQLRVTGGDVVLGARLDLSAAASFNPGPEQVFALVNNAGPGTTSGLLAGYADGEVVTLGGHRLEVRYGYDFGGDGFANDVVLVEASAGPTAVDDQYTVAEDHALVVAAPGVLGNDTDAEGGALTASVIANPAHGAAVLNPDGSFTYTPNVNFNGVDTMVYQVANERGGLAQATVAITVTPVADARHGIHPAVLAWMLEHNPGLREDFLMTDPPDKVVLLPDGRRVQIYQIDQFLDVNFRLNFSSRRKEGIKLVETQELHVRKLMALPEFYHWIMNHTSTYRIAGKGRISAAQAYNYLRRINRHIYVTVSRKVHAPVGGGNGINAPSWAVWKQMNLFWHEAGHVIGIGHNSGGLTGPLAGKLRQWDRQHRWDYQTININELEVPGRQAADPRTG